MVLCLRLVADIMNDVGTFLELLTALFPYFFSLIVCLASVSKVSITGITQPASSPVTCLHSCFFFQAIVGVAGNATRAAFVQHQARKDNMADVAAKDGSQVCFWMRCVCCDPQYSDTSLVKMASFVTRFLITGNSGEPSCFVCESVCNTSCSWTYRVSCTTVNMKAQLTTSKSPVHNIMFLNRLCSTFCMFIHKLSRIIIITSLLLIG